METINNSKTMKGLTNKELSQIYGGGWFYEIGKAVGIWVAETSNSANESLWNEALNYKPLPLH
jgi:bacteriocin-like protein